MLHKASDVEVKHVTTGEMCSLETKMVPLLRNPKEFGAEGIMVGDCFSGAESISSRERNS